jgi:hypothetical protein
LYSLGVDTLDALAVSGPCPSTIHVWVMRHDPDGHVLLLNKSLYGTKQAPHCSNKKFDAWMHKQGIQPSKADPCLYIQCKGGNCIILTVPVNDQLIAVNDCATSDRFKLQINSEFECKGMGPAQHFLGFNMNRDRLNCKLYISQEKYLKDVLQRFDMEDCNPVKYPLPAGF